MLKTIKHVRPNHNIQYKKPFSGLKEGDFVIIPIQNKFRHGIIIEKTEKEPNFPTKNIQSKLNDFISLTKEQISICKFVAKYYFCNEEQSLKLCLPPKFWQTPKLKHINDTEIQAPILKQQKNFVITSDSHKLSSKQQEIYQNIIDYPGNSLLFGITGSGKTEIYRTLINHYIEKGHQALLLVPEISLTPQLIEYFYSQFQEKIALIHSKISPTDKIHEWHRVKNGEAKLIIGSRSALFMPFKNLGVIIMDEEHEWTYKQESTPRYHAKKVAEKLCENFSAKLLLASATPSIDSYFEAQENKYNLLKLPEKIYKQINPDKNSPQMNIQIVDMRDELKKKNFSVFSEILQEKLTKNLKEGKQSILFLNRRGWSNAIVCRDCGSGLNCPHCEIPLTVHKNGKTHHLICHYCGIIKNIPTFCHKCGSIRIKTIGAGTQKIQEELEKLLPTAKILRADRDTTTRKDAFKNIYNAFKARKADILIGTQMIGKGLDLPDVNLVGVILADVGLHIPHFRSQERTFQLITQVAGRTGRRDIEGEVIIQTYSPTNIAIKTAANQDFETFYQKEIENRKKLSYPPYSQIIKILYEDIDEKKTLKKISDLEKSLQDFLEEYQKTKNEKDHHEIYSSPAMPSKIANKYRHQITIKATSPKIFFPLLPTGKKWKIDIDPI